MSRPMVQATGLEGAPDIMLLTMAALMVAIVWLASHAHERTLPPIELPQAEDAQLGALSASSITLTLRPREGGPIEVYLDDERIPAGLGGLYEVLATRNAQELILRADASTRWEDSLRAMDIAARLGLPIAIAGDSN